jgi:enamine deaminase RidA (YjgF/YER057c/UK114 family)
VSEGEDDFEILQPEGWAKPIGYSNGIAATGRLVFVAGQIGWNPTTGEFETLPRFSGKPEPSRDMSCG